MHSNALDEGQPRRDNSRRVSDCSVLHWNLNKLSIRVSHNRHNPAYQPLLRCEANSQHALLMRDISNQVTKYGSLAKLPADSVGNTRNDMYLVSEAIRFLMKDKASELSEDDLKTLKAYKLSLDQATKFIPTWVKIAVAISLGLGTMIGWKRIVITVGEKI